MISRNREEAIQRRKWGNGGKMNISKEKCQRRKAIHINFNFYLNDALFYHMVKPKLTQINNKIFN